MQIDFGSVTLADPTQGIEFAISNSSTPDTFSAYGAAYQQLPNGTAAEAAGAASFRVRINCQTWADTLSALLAPTDITPYVATLSCQHPAGTINVQACLQTASSTHNGRLVTTSYDFVTAP